MVTIINAEFRSSLIGIPYRTLRFCDRTMGHRTKAKKEKIYENKKLEKGPRQFVAVVLRAVDYVKSLKSIITQ